MRIFLVTGLMAATMLTPAAASAAEIAPRLDLAANAVPANLTGKAEAQRDRRANRGTSRNSSRGQARAQNSNNRGTAQVSRQSRTESRSDRTETRTNRRAERTERSASSGPAARANQR